jgi:hypothetical protein
MHRLIALTDEADSVSEIPKGVTVLDAIIWTTSAWETVKPETIQKCFWKCGFKGLDETTSLEIDPEDLTDFSSILPPEINTHDVACFDDHLITSPEFGENWEERIMKGLGPEEEEEDDVNADLQTEVITVKTAWTFSTDLMNFAMSKEDYSFRSCF